MLGPHEAHRELPDPFPLLVSEGTAQVCATTKATRRLRWLLVAAWVLLIFALSSVPGSTITSAASRYSVLTTEGFALFLHFVEYAILAGLLLFATGWRPPTVALALALLLACSLLGAGDVAYRLVVPGRDADPIDWVADTVGAGVAIAAIEVVCRRRASSTPATP